MADQPTQQPQPQMTAGQYFHAMNPKLVVPGETMADEGFTMFVFGDYKTWKTTIAGTFPGVLFLSCQMEGGDRSLLQLPKIYPGVPVPPVWPIKSPTDMQQAVLWIERDARRQGFCTIVIDSLSYYIDLWISDLMEQRKRSLPKGLESTDAVQMRKPDWGALESHICKEVAKRLHSTGLNVIWTCTEKKLMRQNEKDQTQDIVGLTPRVVGGSEKVIGMCSIMAHAARQLVPDQKNMGRAVHDVIWWLQPGFLTSGIGHRFGLSFPEGRLVPAPGRASIDFWSFFHKIPNDIYLGPYRQQYMQQLQTMTRG